MPPFLGLNMLIACQINIQLIINNFIGKKNVIIDNLTKNVTFYEKWQKMSVILQKEVKYEGKKIKAQGA